MPQGLVRRAPRNPNVPNLAQRLVGRPKPTPNQHTARPTKRREPEPHLHHAALHNRLTELATDVGHLRRCVPEGSLLEWRAERVAGHVESMTLMLEPTAAELARWYAPGCDQAVDEAIRIVDARYRSLQHRLGNRPA